MQKISKILGWVLVASTILLGITIIPGSRGHTIGAEEVLSKAGSIIIPLLISYWVIKSPNKGSIFFTILALVFTIGFFIMASLFGGYTG